MAFTNSLVNYLLTGMILQVLQSSSSKVVVEPTGYVTKPLGVKNHPALAAENLSVPLFFQPKNWQKKTYLERRWCPISKAA